MSNMVLRMNALFAPSTIADSSDASEECSATTENEPPSQQPAQTRQHQQHQQQQQPSMSSSSSLTSSSSSSVSSPARHHMLHKKRNSDVVLEDDGEEEATQCYYDDHEDDDADYDDFDDEADDFGSLNGQLGDNRAEKDQNYDDNDDDDNDDDDRLGITKSGSTTYLIAPSNAPLGRWRDSLLCCFRHGMFHPSLWISLCCGPCALAQLTNRVRVNWLGDRLSVLLGKPGNFNLVLHTLFWTGLLSVWIPSLGFLLTALTLLSMVVAVALFRRGLRRRYAINEGACLSGMEDWVLALFCNPCVLMQMMRHTANYQQQPASYCSVDGLTNPDQHDRPDEEELEGGYYYDRHYDPVTGAGVDS